MVILLPDKNIIQENVCLLNTFLREIFIDCVQKAGEANTGVILEEMLKEDMSGLSLYQKLKPKEILANLFKGQPEEKCIEQANKSSIKFRNLFG